METRIQKWGNSLGVRIPKAFADEIGLKHNSTVEVMMKEGELIIKPVVERKWTLEQLLDAVTEENIHHEWETGAAEGDEIW
jgi:antitoxin MazE